MTKQEQINEDIKTAMRNKDTVKLTVLRGLKNAITNAALNSGNAGNSLTDNEVINLIRKGITQRQDSITQFEKGGRPELAANEQGEIDVLNTYLPVPLSEGELTSLVTSVLSELGATSKKQMGAVIKRVVELADGRASNKDISTMVGKSLA